VALPASCSRRRSSRALEQGAYEEAKAYAFRLLSVRARTRREMRERLARRGYSSDVVGAVEVMLVGLEYLDDAAFAEAWLDSKSASGPPGRALALAGLARAGVPAQVASEVVGRRYEGLDEVGLALEAARRRIRRLGDLPEPVARRRLSAYLARRGFSREVVSEALRLIGEDSTDENG